MAITTGDGYIASAKQILSYTKTASITSIANTRFTIFDRAGNPAAGTLAMATALTGEVPTDTTAGFPLIDAFGAGNTGYLTRVQYSSSVVQRLEIWDVLWGINVPLTPAAPTTYTISGASSYLGRCPTGHGNGCRIQIAVSTAVAASAVTVTVGYTNQSGVSGRTTASSGSLSGFTGSRMLDLQLQAGDSGVDSIQSVTVGGTAAATGRINVMVTRPLWTQRVPVVNGGDTHGLDKTGMPIVYADSALLVTTVSDGTSTGVFDCLLEIANG